MVNRETCTSCWPLAQKKISHCSSWLGIKGDHVSSTEPTVVAIEEAREAMGMVDWHRLGGTNSKVLLHLFSSLFKHFF